MNAQKLMLVFTSAPYSNSNGQEALDVALIGAAFEQDVSLLFLHDGVFQIKAGQQTSAGIKQTTKAFAAVNDFGIDDVYVHDLSLIARGLNTEDMMVDVKEIDTKAISSLLNQHDRVLTF